MTASGKFLACIYQYAVDFVAWFWNSIRIERKRRAVEAAASGSSDGKGEVSFNLRGANKLCYHWSKATLSMSWSYKNPCRWF